MSVISSGCHSTEVQSATVGNSIVAMVTDLWCHWYQSMACSPWIWYNGKVWSAQTFNFFLNNLVLCFKPILVSHNTSGLDLIFKMYVCLCQLRYVISFLKFRMVSDHRNSSEKADNFIFEQHVFLWFFFLLFLDQKRLRYAFPYNMSIHSKRGCYPKLNKFLINSNPTMKRKRGWVYIFFLNLSRQFM